MKNKKKFINKISRNLSSIDGVMSVNFVGSFVDGKNYSDIDIVIIIKKLDKKIITKCHTSLKKIKLKSFKINKKLVINDTFGPLKFNTKKNIVFHLMIYSYEDHINHVINSPFTCYDWERSKPTYGKSLKALYPVSKLLISDFFSKNRSISSYKKNLVNKSVNYKKYQFKGNKIVIKKLNYKLNNKNVYEFCYHLMTFLIKNYLKFITQNNKNFNTDKIIKVFNKIYKKSDKKEIIFFYKKLIKFKKNKGIDIDEDRSIKITMKFLKVFEVFFNKLYKTGLNVDFKRHLKTKYDRNIFIGQKINPPIKSDHIKKIKYKMSLSSPSLRSLQTSKIYSKKINSNKLLKEIDYGDVEGLNLKQLKIKFPVIFNKWSNLKDVRFPNGESLKDVTKRVKKFLKYLKKNKYYDKNILVVTHNVFLRCLLGSYFDIPSYKWHMIKINYGEIYKFKLINNVFFIDIHRNKLRSLFKKIYENSDSN